MSNFNGKMQPYTRIEYMQLRDERERNVVQSMVYTAMILFEGIESGAVALPASIEAPKKHLGENVVRLCIRGDDLEVVASSTGTFTDDIWQPLPNNWLHFNYDNGRRCASEEGFLMPFDDGVDLSHLHEKELIGAGSATSAL